MLSAMKKIIKYNVIEYICGRGRGTKTRADMETDILGGRKGTTSKQVKICVRW